MNGCVGWKQPMDGSCASPCELLSHGSLFKPDIAQTKSGEGIIAKFHGIIPSLLKQPHVGL